MEASIIQILTFEALDMVCYRPESTNLTEVEPRSILVFSGRYHIMSNASIVNNCFISLNKNSNNNNKILAMVYVLDSLEFLLFT